MKNLNPPNGSVKIGTPPMHLHSTSDLRPLGKICMFADVILCLIFNHFNYGNN